MILSCFAPLLRFLAVLSSSAGSLRSRTVAACAVAAVTVAASFPVSAFAALPKLPAGSVFGTVQEAKGYGVVYELNIPNTADYNIWTVIYAQDNSAQVASGAFNRVAYALELNTTADPANAKWIWVSFRRPANITSANKLGVPTKPSGASYHRPNGTVGDTPIEDMRVASNVTGIVTGTGISTGNIEFWSGNYGTQNQFGVPNGNGGNYDFADNPVGGEHHNYGSMQIHNYGAQQTLFALNRWGNASGSNLDLGIGNQVGGSGHPDWTFAVNAWTYVTKRLYVLVEAAPMITSSTSAFGSPGVPFTYTITATGAPTSYNATGLPAGLSINTATGVISGTSNIMGTSTLAISATNAYGTRTETLKLAIYPLQSLVVYGTDAALGTIDPNTDCSRDGGATWLPTYAIWHPWGQLGGTTSWIGRNTSGNSDPNVNDANPEFLDLRVRFYAATDITGAQLTYSINADNYGDVFLNGTKVNATQIIGDVVGSGTITNANIVAGLNTILVKLKDTGGLLGINYRLDVQGYGSTPFQRLIAPPSPTAVSSSLANGAYPAGAVIPIQMTFNRAVTVSGVPTLTLATGATLRAATYASGSGTSTLTFNYTVQTGDTSFDLDYISINALSLNGGTIKSTAADLQDANRTLPTPGAAGSLGANKAIVVDGIAPNTALTASPATLSASYSATFTFTATEAGTFQAQLDGGAFTTVASPATVTGLSNGVHTFNVRAVDAAGNIDPTPATFTWTVDAIAPDTTIVSQPANVTASTGATFAFTANEAGATFAISVDGGAFQSASSPATLSGLTNGVHTFSVRATDAAGNTDATPASYTWTVDTIAPETTIVSKPAITTDSSSATFTFTTNEGGATFATSIDGASFTPATSPVTLNGLADGLHTFAVRATDAAGNTDATPASYTWTIDTQPPTISNGPKEKVVAGYATSFAILASRSPTSYAASGLPAGLSVNTTTGVISGTPTAPGVYAVTLSASNVNGTTTAALTLTVNVVTVFASGSMFNGPDGLSLDAEGNVYVPNLWNTNVTKISPLGVITPALISGIAVPIYTTTDSAGSVYVASRDSGTITKLTTAGVKTTYVSGLNVPIGMAFDASGTLYVVESGANRIVKVAPGGGTGSVTPFTISPANSLAQAAALAFDSAGNLIVANSSGTLKKIAPNGTVTSFGTAGEYGAWGLAFDTEGNLYVSTPYSGTDVNQIRKLTPAGVSTLYATGFNLPTGLAFDAAGNLYIANAAGTSISRVGPPQPPYIISPNTAGGIVASAFNYATAATNDPTSYAATGLPAGLAIHATTGVISGTPTVAGTSTVALAATNATGTGNATLTLTIAQATATIALGNLTRPYDGTAKSVSVTTTPAGLATSVTYDGSATAPSAVGSYSVVATITDPNYTGTKSGTLQITDTVAPETAITSTPAALSNSRSATIAFSGTDVGSGVASFEAKLDNGAFAVATSPLTFTGLADGPHTVQVRAKDAAGNLDASPASYTWTVDATGPVITVPTSPVIAEATGPDGAPVSFTVSAADAREGNILATPSAASGSTFPLGNTVVAVAATDSTANTSTKSFTVTVRDTTAPAISVSLPTPPLLDEKFNGYFGGNPTGGQHQSGLAVQYGGNVTGWTKSGFENAVHAVNLSGAGNWAVMFYAPDVLTLTNGIAANAAGETYAVTFVAGPAVYQAPSQATGANDGLVVEILRANGSVLQTCTHKPGAYAGVNTLTPVTFAYTGDGSGAVRVRLRTIDANSGRFGGVIDSLKIALGQGTTGVPAQLEFEATSPAGAVATFDAVAYDLVNLEVPVTASQASGSTFAIGSTPVTLSAVDAAGNPATATFNVIIRDTIKPVLNLPANITAEATNAAGAAVTFAVTATDAAGTPTVVSTPASGSTFALGATTVNVTATDAAGLQTTGSFIVTVADTTKPALTVPADLAIEATGATGAIATFAATATDAVSTPTISYSKAPGSIFALGATTVNVTALDAAGNSSTGSFIVTIADTTRPVVTVPANYTVEATGASGAVVTFSVTATDAVSTPTVISAPASGSVFALGLTTVNVVATDAANNSANASFTVTVADTTKPVLTVPANLTAEATSADGATVTFAATATDAVSTPTIAYSKNSGTTFPIGATVVTVTATDAAGNPSTGVFTVTVADTIAPETTLASTPLSLSKSASATFAFTGTDTGSGVASFEAKLDDGAFATVTSPHTVTGLSDGVHTFVVRAKDVVGNADASPASFTWTIDTQPPTVAIAVIAVDDRLNAAESAAALTISGTTVGAEDGRPVTLNVGATAYSASVGNNAWSITLSAAATAALAEQSHVITVNVSDAAGNAATPATRTLLVDKTAPIAPVVAGISDDTGSSATDGITNDPTLTVRGTAEPLSSVTVFKGGASIGQVNADATGAWSFDYTTTTLAAGDHAFTAQATDAAGNTGATSEAFLATIDTEVAAPVIASISTDSGRAATDGVTNDNTLVFAGTSEPRSTVVITRSGAGVVGTTTTDATGAWSFDYSTTTLADGVYLFTARATDRAGNTSAVSADFPVTVDTAAPVLTANAATGAYKSSFTTTVSANETAVVFVATGLPAGLTLDRSTGVISGAPTQSGAFTVALTATDIAGNTGSASLTLTLNRVNLTIVGVTAADRTYDATTIAALNFASASLVGIVAGDSVTLDSSSAAGAFAAKQIGTAKLVTIAGLALAGADAAHYTFTAPTATASITPRNLTVAGATAANKVYDRNAVAALSFASASLVNVAGSDTVTLVSSAATGTFADAQVGAAKSVTVAGLTLAGVDAGNYTLTAPTLAASITARPLQIAANAQTKVYGSSDPVLTYVVTNLVTGDALTGSLARAAGENVGTYAIARGTLAATTNYSLTFVPAVLTITPADAVIALGNLTQPYDGTPRPVAVGTSPAGLSTSVTYDGSATAPVLPGAYAVVATITNPNYSGSATATLTVTITSLVRHAPKLSGDIDGSVQVMLPESIQLNGNAMISGDLLVPGTPKVRLNGKPTFGGTVDSLGAVAPSNYEITLNGNAVLRKLVRRVDALAMPVVAAPAQPAGTRSVSINRAGDPVGSWATVRDLTLNGSPGEVPVPAGAYGKFVANGGAIVLGVAGSTAPTVYHLQELVLNGNALIKLVGPVVVHLKGKFDANSSTGNSASPAWFELRISDNGMVLNGNVKFYGNVFAPKGEIVLNGNSLLKGRIVADTLTINGNALLSDPSQP